ncbi:hypothetical protein G6F57_015825 [Rhizopus arrhizus]|nr:hypothetical protein G6F57_015825 [Rhizopus arrhizus]
MREGTPVKGEEIRRRIACAVGSSVGESIGTQRAQRDAVETKLLVLVNDGFGHLKAAPGQRRQRRHAVITQPAASELYAFHGPPIAVAARAGALEAMLSEECQLGFSEVVQSGCKNKTKVTASRAVTFDNAPSNGYDLLEVEQWLATLELNGQLPAWPLKQPLYRLFGVRAGHVEGCGCCLLPRHLAVAAGVVASKRDHKDVQRRPAQDIGLAAANLAQQRGQAAAFGACDCQMAGFQISKESRICR